MRIANNYVGNIFFGVIRSLEGLGDNALGEVTGAEVAGSLGEIVVVLVEHGKVHFEVSLAQLKEIVEMLTGGGSLDLNSFVVVNGAGVFVLNLQSFEEFFAESAHDGAGCLGLLRLGVLRESGVAKGVGGGFGSFHTFDDLSVSPRSLNGLRLFFGLLSLLSELLDDLLVFLGSLDVSVLADELVRSLAGISDLEHGVLSVDSFALTCRTEVVVRADRTLVADSLNCLSFTAIADVIFVLNLGLLGALVNIAVRKQLFKGSNGELRDLTDNFCDVAHNLLILNWRLSLSLVSRSFELNLVAAVSMTSFSA